MKIWDADAHVEEWDATFSERFFDPALFDRRPIVIQSQRALHWMCDGEVVMPKFVGGEMDRFFGTPHSINGKRVDTLTKKSETLEALELRGARDRLKLMDEEGIELSVLYPTLFLIWPIARDPILGDACARSYNNWLCEVCSEAPERLKWVSIVDPADPGLAAKEIERTKKMGAAGTMVLGMVGTRAITDPHFSAIWDAAGQVDMPISVHVGECTPLGYLAFHQSLLMAFWRLAFTGILDRYPKLHVSFLEAGCAWVPYLMGRLEDLTHGQRFSTIKNPGRSEKLPSRLIGVGGLAAIDAPWPELTPEEYIKRGNIFFGFEVEEKLLPWCIEEYGADCWLFGSDIPHYDRLKHAARVFQERTDISEENKRKLLCENTARFYKWPMPS